MGCKPNKPIAQGIALGIQAYNATRPVRAKALETNAFALTGRVVTFAIVPQGDALGYGLMPLSGRIGCFN